MNARRLKADPLCNYFAFWWLKENTSSLNAACKRAGAYMWIDGVLEIVTDDAELEALYAQYKLETSE